MQFAQNSMFAVYTLGCLVGVRFVAVISLQASLTLPRVRLRAPRFSTITSVPIAADMKISDQAMVCRCLFLDRASRSTAPPTGVAGK